jgi:wobble nucleotide-excising tRNase
VLKQIKKIKGLGVFENYTAESDLPVFGRYNVVYGENGSGKTTLSRLMACLESGSHPEYPSLEYAVESQSGQITNGKKYGRKVRVFNTDYIAANIGGFDGPLRHILILGEENKAVAAQLKVEIATRDSRLASIEEHGSAIAKLDTDKGKLFSQIARTIGEATSGTSLRSYRKPDAEAAYAKLINPKALSEKDLENHRATVRQEQMASLGSPQVPNMPSLDGGGVVNVIEMAAGAATRAKQLSNRSAQSAVIERLAANSDIAIWVEEGIQIHAAHSPERCEFCDRPMPADRLKALADHFSVEDQILREEIEAERLLTRTVIETLDRFALPDRLALYSELRADYETAIQLFESELIGLKTQLHGVDKALTEKLGLRTTAYDLDVNSDTEPLVAALDSVASVITRHDDKTASFEKEKQSARDAIEAHYLLSIREQVNEFNAAANALRAKINLLRNGGEELEDNRSLEALSQSITDKQAAVSSEHAGGANLTGHLKQFLGRTDLRFESGPEGYLVLRRGKPARRLSEGEKTAIAFLYFLVQLKDQDFDLDEGIVVIDDPISSLDASAIYQAFSFLKNETQSAKQLFILTHNFDFLKLLINWIRNIPGVAKPDKSYTMLLCTETEVGRCAKLAPLDNLLIEHATEYHYLFKVLYTFRSDGTILGCYHVPNIARKVLESFLDFHVPSSKSLYQKLEDADFDPHKKTAIYKFASDLSHHTGKSFDPALVAEAQKNTTYLLEMIEAVAPLHYQGLKKLSEAA